MQIKDFKAIVETFADPGTEMLFEKTQVVIQVNGDLIEANISSDSGDVYIDEGSGKEPASKWIVNRLARLQLLAARLSSSVMPTNHFVIPAAGLLPTLESGPEEEIVTTENALATTIETLNNRSPLETTVLYITSDAGEGKTSLINEMSRAQAKLFTENKTDWLMVPIPLGGRHFLRFDDITIGALQNRYRFPFLYYNSFLALVKMGVIVPAFDGFEEMFVESSSGEALSAMGILVGSLESQGAMIVAARKAYFEFENLKTQERLFDSIRNYSVGFGKIELERWAEKQFIDYCNNRNIPNSKELYQKVSERLGTEHAILTRAVLVKRLIDVVNESSSLDGFLEKIQQSGTDFFSAFVRSLIEREANEKWIDRSGDKDVGAPLLKVEEHCDILAQVSLSMWEAKVDYLKRENLEFVADYFSEVNRKDNYEAQQIRERIRGHAMLVPSSNSEKAVEFDHDEFRLFFLGEGIAKQLLPMTKSTQAEVFSVFRRGVLPPQAQHALVLALKREANTRLLDIVKFLLEISGMDVQTSYTHENCSDIIVMLLDGIKGYGISLSGLAFGVDILRDKKLNGIKFVDCYFSPTSLELTEIDECELHNCDFSQIRVYNSTRVSNVIFDECVVDALSRPEEGVETWDPVDIKRQVLALGFTFTLEDGAGDVQDEEFKLDLELRNIEKIIRYFMRSTHISESVIKIKLGPNGSGFIENELPRLIKNGVLEEIENRGGMPQRRFKLNPSLHLINEAIARSNGSFEKFLQYCSNEN
ncbi:MAG: hypothetical protein OEY36_08460 [Gammaproteobacteria bacterium]|nr:hypothetical protein [Gammaproteobacteria bacterium]